MKIIGTTEKVSIVFQDAGEQFWAAKIWGWIAARKIEFKLGQTADGEGTILTFTYLRGEDSE